MESIKSFYIGSTPTFLYIDLYLNTAYATHYVFFTILTLYILAPTMKMAVLPIILFFH